MPPCVLLQATFEDFSNKLYSAPSVNDSKRFSKPKLSRSDFTIDHYAGGWAGRELLVSFGCPANC
jgi:myosin heavy subunit